MSDTDRALECVGTVMNKSNTTTRRTASPKKRSREEDGSDSMPLSKRINNLHINNNSINFHTDQHRENGRVAGDHMVYQRQMHHMQQNASSEIFFPSSESSSNEENSEQFHNSHDLMSEYSPELDQHQNPFYYNKNKLLYELHAERLRRSNH